MVEAGLKRSRPRCASSSSLPCTIALLSVGTGHVRCGLAARPTDVRLRLTSCFLLHPVTARIRWQTWLLTYRATKCTTLGSGGLEMFQLHQ